MNNLYNNHWNDIRSYQALKLAVALSLVFHVLVGFTLMSKLFTPNVKPKPVVYQMEFAKPFVPEMDKKQSENAPPPKPTPPPKPKEAKKAEKKPEPKPKLKPKPKPPEKKKVVKKPDPPKKKPKPKIKPKTKPAPPKPPAKQPEVVAKPQTKKGVQTDTLPNVLSAWARLVQRKVEKSWYVPGGIQLTDANKEVHISFWVDRNGNLLGKPEVVKAAADPTLGASGTKAILAAVPLPPLPNEFNGTEQQIVYVFSLFDQ